MRRILHWTRIKWYEEIDRGAFPQRFYRLRNRWFVPVANLVPYGVFPRRKLTTFRFCLICRALRNPALCTVLRPGTRWGLGQLSRTVHLKSSDVSRHFRSHTHVNYRVGVPTLDAIQMELLPAYVLRTGRECHRCGGPMFGVTDET